MSEMIETYEARAKRLGLDPTEVCIACGSDEVRQVHTQAHHFCDRHVDWEQKAVILCDSCKYRVGLTCDVGVSS